MDWAVNFVAWVAGTFGALIVIGGAVYWSYKQMFGEKGGSE